MTTSIIAFPTARVREAMLIEKKWTEYKELLKQSGSQYALDLTATKHEPLSLEERRVRQNRKSLNFMFAYGVKRE